MLEKRLVREGNRRRRRNKKFQLPITKIQTNYKFQNSKLQTFLVVGILAISYWILFVIWCLAFDASFAKQKYYGQEANYSKNRRRVAG
jgi:hypothetical protein